MTELRSNASAVELEGKIYVTGGYTDRFSDLYTLTGTPTLEAIVWNSLSTAEMFAYFFDENFEDKLEIKMKLNKNNK